MQKQKRQKRYNPYSPSNYDYCVINISSNININAIWR